MGQLQEQLILRDSTMREGLDVPGVTLDSGQKRVLLNKLAEAGVSEVELVAPGHFERDLQFVRELGVGKPATVRLTGLLYGHDPDWRQRISRAWGLLDRLDILVPLADQRPPVARREKSARLLETLGLAIEKHGRAGAGFPHATQVDQEFLLEMCQTAVQAGAARITIYDTNGGADPWMVAELVAKVRGVAGVEIGFHAHNDLGLAAANSLAAARAGAVCLDVTVNGLGDRAGNAGLEQVALLLHTRGLRTGLRLERLPELSQLVAAMTGVPVAGLAPVVGDFAFCHKSPGHLAVPELFEPFDPALVGRLRKISRR